VVRAAESWRSLESDGTIACQAAAHVLKSLGADDLAWDYLTTEADLRPETTLAWLKLARDLRGEGAFVLADRAYGVAWEKEPANAQILWERALNLQEAGKAEQAQPLLRQLAEGKWQPRFGWIQEEARRQLESP
jgi:hypothetical protein